MRFLIQLLKLALVLPLLGVAVLVGLVVNTQVPPPVLPTATEIFDVNGVRIARLFQENRTEVALSAVPEPLRLAVLAAEDERFYRHRGVDPRGIIRALWRNLQAGQVMEGGSTITQQLARDLYLTRERVLSRKLKEALMAMKLEMLYSKDELLQLFLNTTYLGRGAFGVAAAAQTYFGKDVADLSLAEAALIAGLPRGPELYNPFVNPAGALARRNLVLQRMADIGYLNVAAATAAQAEPLHLAPDQPVGGEAAYFVSYVQEQIARAYPQIAENLRAGGYRIYTSLDLELQRIAHTALARGLPPGTADSRGVLQPQGAVLVMAPRTGAVLAMVGGRDFHESPYNRAVLARRQPGSAFKPFLYAALLETEYFTAATPQICEPVEFPAGAGRPPWQPTDFNPEHPYHNAAMGMRQAIRISDNVVAARWIDIIKPTRVQNTARALGITSTLTDDLTLALGTSEVTVLEMTRAAAALANGGNRVEPLVIYRIIDPQGQILVENQPIVIPAIDERVAYILTDLLRTVVQPGGTAGNIAAALAGRPAAGKTGTTEHGQDAWFVGYTPDLAVTVWAGNDDPAEQPAGELWGAGLAAPIWADIVNRALAGRPATPFARPDGIVERAVCSDSGLLATPFCESTTELFILGTEPTAPDPRIPLWLPALPGLPIDPYVPDLPTPDRPSLLPPQPTLPPAD